MVFPQIILGYYKNVSAFSRNRQRKTPLEITRTVIEVKR